MNSIIINFNRFFKTLFFLIFAFIFFLGVLNITFYFLYFRDFGFFPNAATLKIFSFLFDGFKLSPPWISTWFSSPHTGNAEDFNLFSYLMVGISYLAISFLSLYFLISKKFGIYFIWISLLIIFFLPFGYVLGSVSIVITLIVIIINSETKKLYSEVYGSES